MVCQRCFVSFPVLLIEALLNMTKQPFFKQQHASFLSFTTNIITAVNSLALRRWFSSVAQENITVQLPWTT